MWRPYCRVGLFFFLVCTVQAASKSDFFSLETSVRTQWTDDYIISNLQIRLVKRTWFPGPTPTNTEEVLAHAPYEVEEAYNILKSSSLYDHEVKPFREAKNLFLSPGYDPTKDSIFVINTVSENDENFVKTTIAALALRNLHVQYNLFTIIMPHLDDFMMVTIKRVLLGFHNQYKTLGRIISGFMQEGITMNKLRPDQINLIGFCFSAQLTGYIARPLPGKINSILALDPYSFGLWRFSMTHLSKRDAKTVHIIHTSSMYQGTYKRDATADFVFNNGNLQPECFVWNVECSHERSVPLVWYVILFSDLFIVRQCSSYVYLRTCLCNWNPTTHITYPLNPAASGTYYIRTAAHHPYGLKEIGASCSPFSTPEKATDLTRNKTADTTASSQRK